MTTVHPDYEHLRPFIGQLPSLFMSEGELVYRKRNIVKRFVAPDGTVLVVKRYKYPNLIQRVAYGYYRPSKARRSYDYALRLLDLGIDTPLPIACIEQYGRCHLFTYGYFVSAENNNPSLKALLQPDCDDRSALALQFATFLVSLHEKGFLHGDTNLSNFLYERQSDGTYHFSVIDINRSHFVSPPVPRRTCLQNLMRLTHDVPTLSYLVGIYAHLRGWDPVEASNSVCAQLRKFERKKRLKHRVKRLKVNN